MMAIELREFVMQDYDRVIELWRNSEGIGLSAADAPERIQAYLERNPGSSFTAWDGDRLVGAVLCGHDGRRGYLHHLAVAPDYRGRGIGRQLASRCLQAMADLGIDKVHIVVFKNNKNALDFWQRTGWYTRDELKMLSIDL